MLYCPRCNNTHWERAPGKSFKRYLWLSLLRREYRCLKCGKNQWGFALLDFHLRFARKDRRKPVAGATCPKCQEACRRSRRRLLERLIPFQRAYRCVTCSHRFRIFRFR